MKAINKHFFFKVLSYISQYNLNIKQIFHKDLVLFKSLMTSINCFLIFLEIFFIGNFLKYNALHQINPGHISQDLCVLCDLCVLLLCFLEYTALHQIYSGHISQDLCVLCDLCVLVLCFLILFLVVQVGFIFCFFPFFL